MAMAKLMTPGVKSGEYSTVTAQWGLPRSPGGFPLRLPPFVPGSYVSHIRPHTRYHSHGATAHPVLSAHM